MRSTFGQSVVDRVHSMWENNRSRYPKGYGVFYSHVHFQPELMLIGLNPGGNDDAAGKKEQIMSKHEKMEYILNKDNSEYPIAGKTVDVFESIGQLHLLEQSVKINENFFRSRNIKSLCPQHAGECSRIVSEIIGEVQPRILICESIGVFDRMLIKLSKGRKQKSVSKEMRVALSNHRLVTSVEFDDDNHRPIKLVGYSHRTGSHLRSEEVDKIREFLKIVLTQLSD